MKFRAAILVLTFAFARPLFALPCAAYPPGSWKFDKVSALQFERDWLQVLTQKNVAALDCMLSNEFKDTSMKAVLRPKAQVLRELPLRSNQYQQSLTNLEADLFDQTAVVRGVDLVSDQQGHEVFRIRFTDTLRFTDGRWLAVAAQETPEQQPPSH